jgi:hypothetical protein
MRLHAFTELAKHKGCGIYVMYSEPLPGRLQFISRAIEWLGVVIPVLEYCSLSRHHTNLKNPHKNRFRMVTLQYYLQLLFWPRKTIQYYLQLKIITVG